MDKQSEPRNIDLSKARYTAPRADRTPPRTPAQEPQREPDRPSPAGEAKRPKTKKRRRVWKVAAVCAAVALCLCLAAYGALKVYSSRILNTGEMGTLNTETVRQTAPEFRGEQVNILVLGISYTTSDADVTYRDEVAPADMILYVRVDLVNNQIRMLQIPRDTFVGDVGGVEGKINGIFTTTTDTENRVNAVAEYISQNFGLPIDNYVAFDLEGLKAIVDFFGGIDVYIPSDIITYDDYGNISYALYQGWNRLRDYDLEYFLRARSAAGMQLGDVNRLQNQRYFYSAVFRKIKTASVSDLIKLVPYIGERYINTDFTLEDAIGLAIRFLSIPSENIMICSMPVYFAQQYYKDAYAVVVTAKAETVELFNQYFLEDPEDLFTVDEITTPDYPLTTEEPITTPVQWMGEIDAAGVGEEGEPVEEKELAEENAANNGGLDEYNGVSSEGSSESASAPAA